MEFKPYVVEVGSNDVLYQHGFSNYSASNDVGRMLSQSELREIVKNSSVVFAPLWINPGPLWRRLFLGVMDSVGFGRFFPSYTTSSFDVLVPGCKIGGADVSNHGGFIKTQTLPDGTKIDGLCSDYPKNPDKELPRMFSGKLPDGRVVFAYHPAATQEQMENFLKGKGCDNIVMHTGGLSALWYENGIPVHPVKRLFGFPIGMRTPLVIAVNR